MKNKTATAGLPKATNNMHLIIEELNCSRSIRHRMHSVYNNLRLAVKEYKDGKLFLAELSCFRFYHLLYDLNAHYYHLNRVHENKCRRDEIKFANEVNDARYYAKQFGREIEKIKTDLWLQLKSGAAAYLNKRNSSEELATAIANWNLWLFGLSESRQ